jgi:phosphohistidine phosphatase
LRHAKSAWDDPSLGDHDRPLNPRGRQAAHRLAHHFRSRGLRPELVLCSTATRAVQTLAPISEAMRLDDRTRVEPGLYGATAAEILARVRLVDGSVGSVLVVAHNPGLQDLAFELAGADPDLPSRLAEKFPTGALAEIRCGGDGWSDLASDTAQLVSLTFPRDLADDPGGATEPSGRPGDDR